MYTDTTAAAAQRNDAPYSCPVQLAGKATSGCAVPVLWLPQAVQAKLPQAVL
jgi:hypothetical protein